MLKKILPHIKVEYGQVKERVTQKRGSFFRHVAKYDIERAQAYLNQSTTVRDDKYQLQIKNTNSQTKISLNSLDDKLNFWRVTLPAKPREIFLGAGQQFSHLNLKGEKVPIWSEEQGIGRNNGFTSKVMSFFGVSGNQFTSYSPLPVFVSSQNYAGMINTNVYAELEFLSTKTIISIFGPSATVTLVANQFPQLPNTIKKEITPHIMAPEWIYKGGIVGLQGGSKRVKRELKGLVEKGCNINGVWIQDWCGENHNLLMKQVKWDFSLDKNRYHNFRNLQKYLKHNDIKLLGYLNTFLQKDTPQYKHAKRQGYLVKDKNKSVDVICLTTFIAGLIDLTNPEAYQWYKSEIIKNMVEEGFSGWMADYGEHMWRGYYYHDQTIPPEDVHYHYIQRWNQLNHEIHEEHPDLYIFQRSTSINSVKNVSAFWLGDHLHNLQTDDGLPSAVLGLITASLSGLNNVHFDAGGYTTVPWLRRTKRLLKRWLEIALFTPVLRTHEGSLPALNAQIYSDDQMIEFFKKITLYKGRMEKIVRSYIRKGKPLIKLHPEWIKNRALIEIYKYQYMFADDILVAAPYDKKFKYYLPEGEWINVWDGYEQSSGIHWSNFRNPCPVFVKASSKLRDVFAV